MRLVAVFVLAWTAVAMAGDLEAVIVPDKGYDLFLPDAQGKTVAVHVELRDAATHAKSTRRFRATLALESSHLPGACVNCPPAKGPEPADLYFDAAANPRGRVGDGGTSLALPDGRTLATISSRDWGGYATLRAHVVVDGVTLEAVTSDGGAGLAIPRDDNANHVADYWELLGNVRHGDDAAADDEVTPALAMPGDGIALVDEYRGFLEDDAAGKQVHVRLNPNQRDAFVSLAHVAPRDRPRALAGVALWAATTNLAVHLGHANTELDLRIDRATARAAVDGMICVVDPACAADPARRAAFDQGSKLDAAQRKLRAGWAGKHTENLVDLYLAFVVVRDLGRALHAREPRTEPTCPMHVWETSDPAVADFVGGLWDLATAPGGAPWQWCDDQMRIP